jgi:hypothetical protein
MSAGGQDLAGVASFEMFSLHSSLSRSTVVETAGTANRRSLVWVSCCLNAV